MDGLSLSLLLGAGAVGSIHTLLGPDHYLPFITMARVQRWSLLRTVTTVTLCGLAHVLASVALGTLGLAAGAAIGEIQGWEAGRGNVAAWAMVAFGLAYGLWGARRALRSSAELEPHQHGGHVHIHRQGAHAHAHADGGATRPLTLWMLMMIFVVGPCEPLLPLFVVPASRGRWDLAAGAVAVFALSTVLSMLAATLVALAGLQRWRLGLLTRWGHTLAGAAVAASGLAVITLGL